MASTPAEEWLARVRRAVDGEGRPAPGPMTTWEVFPFEPDGLRAKPITGLTVPEPDRSRTPSDCQLCGRVADPSRQLVEGERLVVVRAARTSLVFAAQVVARAHEGLGDLDVAGHEELGRLLGATYDAVGSLDGVGRVHINKWENGAGHLMFAVTARPEGVLELRGSNQPIWADMLPDIPEQELADRAHEVRRALAAALGRA